ncbi:MAG: ABC transporter ATP-binding protein [Anaerolineae bacterium]|nr:ABC transporter ATP-binding protein [Anaerolineae bacterium]
MLELKNVHLSYGPNEVLKGISLNIGQGEIICLLGQSGSDKTSLLRVIAGLEQETRGSIVLAGERINGQKPQQRHVGLMFQDYALFPHMSVAENIAFGLRSGKMDAQQVRQRVDELLHLVRLDGYQDRPIDQLSGGEQQRVALARSLAPRPRLLMLDEPLGSLDASLRETLVKEVHDIIKLAGLTAIYVTHDQQEAFVIADRIAIMQHGQIEQIATPQELYYRPHSRFVVEFLGLHNVVSADCEAIRGLLPDDTSREFLIHPKGISLADEGPNAVVTEVIFSGDRTAVTVEVPSCGSWRFLVYDPLIRLDVGQQVYLHIDHEFIIPLANK